ncbi:alpha/beta-hydrolase [Durotheca rogersii]|uniref:alpha/beta-hydrolase n=1 Tax=Durotheca rogersii TaxID=419775 RepID=UPI002220CE19|nr:alpha/beta-hydrolase [Durotheca rogersii]KAI5861511.1 alpha/beta-hydrolase [Durotheca rogersii]
MSRDACAEIPPVSSDYVPKGTYETVGGLKTCKHGNIYIYIYVIGPPSATRAIIDLYDVFGLSPQTLQGADRLSAALDALVIVPDFFAGVYAQHEWLPPDTDEKKEAFARFRAEQAALPKNVEKLLAVRRAAAERWPSTTDRWGAFGLCWGGKVAVLVSGKANEGPSRLFKATGAAHPGLLAAEDAEALTTPHICLPSSDEPADVVAQYKEIYARLGKTGVVETYGTMFHGWMGARSNLADEKNKAEYERGYNQVADFFDKYL